MSVGVVIPFRGLSLGKTRLRERLNAATVEALSERMLANVVVAVRRALPDAPVLLITRTRAGLSLPVGVSVLEQALDLNDALEFGRQCLVQRGLERMLVLSSDLPLLQADDVGTLLAVQAAVAVAPDEARRGTNALVCPVSAERFFRFGDNSARAHATEARRRNLSCAAAQTSSLARDIDTVDQIDDAVRMACAPPRSRD